MNQTYNTPALATLVMLDAQVRWMNDNGGLDFAAGRSAQSAAMLYGWADASSYATPFVADAEQALQRRRHDRPRRQHRCHDRQRRAAGQRHLDTDSYRKLGRNQLRIGMFPAIDPSDVEALTRCIDHVVGALG